MIEQAEPNGDPAAVGEPASGLSSLSESVRPEMGSTPMRLRVSGSGIPIAPPVVAVEQPVPTVRGWYPDPQNLDGRERWWSGTEWTSSTHRPPRNSIFGWQSRRRLYWAGPNRDALIGSICSRAGWILWFLSVLAARFGFALNPTGILSVAFLICVAGLVFSIRGVVKAKRLGALPLSIFGVVLGGLTIALSLTSAVFATAL